MVLLWLLLALYVLYRLVDYLIRLPKHRTPTCRIKYVLVTGCDTGFGSLFAKRLDQRGFYVFAACLKEKARDELQKSSSSRLQAFVMDVSKGTSIKAGFDYVKSYIPDDSGLWAVVNNAGITGNKIGPAEWLTREDFLEVFNVNFFGTMNVINTFLPLVKKVKGRIINTTSIVGRFAMPGSGPYDCSKYAAEGYSDCIRRELRPFGVTVHIIEPGFFSTRLTNPQTIVTNVQRTWDSLPIATKEEYGESYFQSTISLIEDSMPRLLSSRLRDVIDAYEHAVLAYRPRDRYLVGWNARFLFWPLSVLPEWMSDGLIAASRHMPVPAVIDRQR